MLTAHQPLPFLINDMMPKLTTFPSRLSLIAILVGLTATPLHAATAPVAVVAGSWQKAVGTVHTYNWVGQPRGGQVTDDGIVSFVGNLGGLSAQGLWSGTPGAMSAIALPGQQAPGYPNNTGYYGSFFDIQRLDNGQYLFGGSVTSTGQALWKGTAGSLTRILRGCSQSFACRKLGHEKEIPQRHQQGSLRRNQATAGKRAKADQAEDG